MAATIGRLGLDAAELLKAVGATDDAGEKND